MQTNNRNLIKGLRSFSLSLLFLTLFAAGAAAQKAAGEIKVKVIQNADKTWGYAVENKGTTVYTVTKIPMREQGYPSEAMATEVSAILQKALDANPAAVTNLSNEKIMALITEEVKRSAPKTNQ